MDMLIAWAFAISIVGIPFAAIMFFITRSINKNGGPYWRKQKVFNIIVSHRAFAIAEISKLSGISEKKLIPTLRYIISEANTSPHGINLEGIGVSVQTSVLGDVSFLRGARLDLNKMEIVLAEIEPDDSKWACPFCNSKNFVGQLVCTACNARKQA